MPAYCAPSAGNPCIILAYSTTVYQTLDPGIKAQLVFVQTANPGIWNICAFIKYFGGPFIATPQCNCAGQSFPIVPPPSQSPTDPPEVPPEEGPPECGPAMIIPEGDHITSSRFWNLGKGASQASGNHQFDTMAQPFVIGMTPLPAYNSDIFSIAKPVYTQQPRMDIKKSAGGNLRLDVFHEGTGFGALVFHPPELQDFHLHGANVNVGSKWPTDISETNVLLLNSGRADGSTGDNAITRLSFGTPLRRNPELVGSGGYFELNLTTNFLEYHPTDSGGGDVECDGIHIFGRLWLEPIDITDPACTSADAAGMIAFDSNDGLLKYYDGVQWQVIATVS